MLIGPSDVRLVEADEADYIRLVEHASEIIEKMAFVFDPIRKEIGRPSPDASDDGVGKETHPTLPNRMNSVGFRDPCR